MFIDPSWSGAPVEAPVFRPAKNRGSNRGFSPGCCKTLQPKRATAARVAAVDANCRNLLLGAVLVGVVFGCLLRVMRGIVVMPLSYLGMVRRLFVIAGFVMLGSFPMMIGRMLMMIGGFGVVMCSFL
jgi:hypothetical protein